MSTERSCLFPALVGLSVAGHLVILVFSPAAAEATTQLTFAATEIVLEAPPPPPPPLEPPPPAEEHPMPAPRAAPVAARPTVLEEATSARDVAIEADVAATASMPAEPPPPAPVALAPIAPPPPIVIPAPAPVGPAIVPSKSLGKLPRAPALDAELERNYPADAKRAGIAGNAMLRVQVLADGRLGKVEHVSESHPGFGAACERTVRSARRDPPLDREGRAVATEIKYACKFEVRR